MKIKKTITDKVHVANRKNAQKSTGPKNADAVKQNACTHGLLSRNLHFQNEEDKREFEEMLNQFQADQNTSGLLESILVEEAASSIWKLRMTENWDVKELLKRRSTAEAVLQAVAENNADEELLLHNYGEEAVQRAWYCQELVIRTDSRNAEDAKNEDGSISGIQKKIGRAHV